MSRPGPLLRRLLALPTALYHHGWGFLLGERFLELEHVGRRTGRTHHTVLEVVAHVPGTGEVAVLAGFGATSDWLLNLRSGGPARVHLGRRDFAARCRSVPAEEAESLLGGYERRNRLAGPVVRRVLSALVGWPYDGTPAARRRLVEQLPMVALAPQSPEEGRR
ncbi:nitroreductase family deazaflavin-dependent oxidoreductase [Spongisporangium articulatum]|uniref:Nitroreductase family deazaflavin-dependent oxidoreductase n=1 Tax=Spongisporangium articulatum TaxID=3362603 RepID=A0ABW8AM33_9ACTN